MALRDSGGCIWTSCVQLRILNQYTYNLSLISVLCRPAHILQVCYVFSMFSLHILVVRRYIYEINHTVSDILATFFMRAH